MNVVSTHAMTVLHIAQKRLGTMTRGATAVEYGLLVALISAVIIAAVTLFGTNLSSMFSQIATAIQP